MKDRTRQMFFLSMSFALTLLFYLHDAEACESSDIKSYSINKDSLGRLIILRANLREKLLQISIDQEPSKIISLPGQECYDFLYEVTHEGDIIVLWMAVDPNKELYSLYTASLPYEKEWTKPVCLTSEEEYINPKSLKLIVASNHDISIFWESTFFFESTNDPKVLAYKTELRKANGTIDSWSQTSTYAQLYNSDTGV
jgi:hypothetical protein